MKRKNKARLFFERATIHVYFKRRFDAETHQSRDSVKWNPSPPWCRQISVEREQWGGCSNYDTSVALALSPGGQTPVIKARRYWVTRIENIDLYITRFFSSCVVKAREGTLEVSLKMWCDLQFMFVCCCSCLRSCTSWRRTSSSRTWAWHSSPFRITSSVLFSSSGHLYPRWFEMNILDVVSHTSVC